MIDSSTIVALMSQLQSNPINTFSIGYRDEPEISELKYARIIADTFKTQHHELYLTPADFFNTIDTFLEHCEEPIVESAGIALFKLAQMAKPYATVLLSGEGSDELFAGYDMHHAMKKIERKKAFLKWAPANAIKRVLSLFALPEERRMYFEWLFTPLEKRYKSISYNLMPRTKERMYTPAFQARLTNKLDDYFDTLYRGLDNKSLLRKMQYIDIKSWLADDILIKTDRMTMAASVEMRCPFLDQEVVEFAASIPDNYKMNGLIGKFILKEVVKDMLPKDIINREKRGFPVPLARWFGGELYDKACTLLLDRKTVGRDYFRKDYLENLVKDVKTDEVWGRRLFSLIVLELWHRKYID